ncbi:hypothetical protein ABPD29_00955 [Secundilactobacillus paracollinoides]|uniref:hypothetical protein n=1 Tax=Secundilactobacillus paracollinoides TaxID=240427 RepID=UPI003F4723FF
MSLLAIIVDIIALGGYYFQLNAASVGVYWVGFMLEIILTLILIVFCFNYKGRRFRNPWIFGFYMATLPYGIILISMVLNLIMVFLYGLNVFGVNSVVFSGY